MSYRTQVITVFGGSGFIGRHLIRRLAKSGAVVRIATRNPTKAGFLKTAGAVGQIVPFATDVTKDESVARALQGADIAINLIGVLYEQGRQSFQGAHVESAARIARIASLNGVTRLVHVSALGADASSPASYARSKAAGEQAVLDAFPQATILRPSIVFGPEDQFFNKFAAMAQIAPALPLIGGGKTRFQPVYVGDLADAIVASLDLDSAKGRTFELGGPRVYSFKELLQLTLKTVQRKRYLLPVPWGAAETLGGVLEKVPVLAPALTRDQVELLKRDNVVSPGAAGFKELGIDTLASCEVIVPTYLARFIVGGRNPTVPGNAH
ncbi:complex I NDUFA9 subunit family protein [Azospirillum doebereinerae]|uniref:Complex I NDUFA9 subunit family protein n=1 Tax=Azospirillum doebereinerae TaxID=92933 RepID=A0A433J2K7_9PROT|nr:complex I NDUFA9 subunit family protein [Azospirillum doebereinerae]MCG5242274.1 complex I NDUFA9 subunit family protein [Azospirillum doebereinerae]RUQ65924.1 complex I NDUFA9 subunit family protein [Azospirillum doebereinerae]